MKFKFNISLIIYSSLSVLLIAYLIIELYYNKPVRRQEAVQQEHIIVIPFQEIKNNHVKP